MNEIFSIRCLMYNNVIIMLFLENKLLHYLIIYYYYFWQDGYEGFDPAYLLIFDTRTNEASWLRVGWR